MSFTGFLEKFSKNRNDAAQSNLFIAGGTAMSEHGTAFQQMPGWYVEFQMAVLRALPRDINRETADGWRNNGEALAKNFRQILIPPDSKPLAPSETIDTIIRIDRSIRPAYPDWVQMVMHPELEDTGPAEFDLAEVEQWLHNKQKRGVVEGNVIYQFLKDNDMLKTCLGLRDGEEIQKKGIDLFRRFFKGKAVYLWKSVVRDRDGFLGIPYLGGGGSGVIVSRSWLDRDWYSSESALRFANQP
ncbi:MAG: hypothetical protein A2359_05050 [Candidatus Moranbacteria bacterium RIFOXYB1_FULL_43_19]|nr:MAG: hypothetical protein A2359_05050 [Candidatus Moranbacteria bacterium RIFOXYB1_FULL_43_19]OGI28815.1 MAG: hypothetical protein A2184_01650 [Candidatus Moranbacteria bacterium RIFOXYA1_FULL_44_7]OGI33619.1 MAG: hypothetical protein A2420_00680 [Candidatus Moranbacteria bacterium RIFOXYC1_FULL_44_13]